MPAMASDGLNMFLYYSIIINVVLAVFNLLPIPPLDGSKVMAFFLSPSLERAYLRLEPFGMWILIALLATGLLSRIFNPLYNLIIRILSLVL